MKITGTRMALWLTSAVVGAPSGAVAQALKDVRTPETPLVLKAQQAIDPSRNEMMTRG